MRRRSLAIPIALLAVLILAAGAVAGGWATVALTDTSVDPPAGAGTTIELEVLQHGQTAVSWPKLTVVATNDSTGETFSTQATPQGPTGHYVATMTFPTEGAWTLSFASADLIMEGAAEMQVAAAVAPPANPSTPAVATIDPVLLGLAALVALAVVAGAAIVIRGRHAGPRDERASVSG